MSLPDVVSGLLLSTSCEFDSRRERQREGSIFKGNLEILLSFLLIRNTGVFHTIRFMGKCADLLNHYKIFLSIKV